LNNVYVFGSTPSTNFPVTTGVYQRTNGGDYDAILAKFGSYLPAITGVSPNEIIQNADATTLTITGTNFASGASVKFDGAALATTFTSSTILSAILPTSLISVVGTHNISVYNPLDDGGTSGNKTMNISARGFSHPPPSVAFPPEADPPLAEAQEGAVTPIVTPAETSVVTPVTPPITSPATTVTVVPAVDPNTTGAFSPASAKDSTPSLQVDLNIVRSSSTSTICIPETIVKSVSNSSVYYCGEDGLRYAFADENVYFAWFKDIIDVKIISDSELAQVPLGTKIITHRPGMRMIKVPSSPKVYAVARGGILRWVKTEATAKTLYGDNWNTQIDDLSEALFTNYTVGEPVGTSRR